MVLKRRRVTQERVEKYLSDTYFVDVNLKGRHTTVVCPLFTPRACARGLSNIVCLFVCQH